MQQKKPIIGRFYTYNHSDYTNLALCYRVEKDYYYFIEHDDGADNILWFNKVTPQYFEKRFVEDTYTDYHNYWQMFCFRQGLVWLFTERKYHTVYSDYVTKRDIMEVEAAVNIFNANSGIKDKLGAHAFNYKDYLQTSHWKNVRDMKILQVGNKCQLCGSQNRLEVHHNSYEHLWMEEMYLEDLIVLCHNCHAKFHDKMKDYE